MVEIKVDIEKCDACKACIEVCPFGVFKFDNRRIIVANPERWLLCMACEAECPHDAIKVIQ